MWWLTKGFVSRMRKLCAEVSDAEVWVSGTMPVLWECYECRDDGASVGEVPVGVRGDVNRVGSDVLGFRGCRRFRGSDAKFVCQSVGHRRFVGGTMPVLWGLYECREDGAGVGGVTAGVRGEEPKVGVGHAR